MRKYTPEEQELSFWNNIAITADDNQCWLWKAYCLPKGYGQKRWNGKSERAHRIAWSLPDYVIPAEMDICHSCDNPKCCNPKHLFLGTRQENVDDMMKKGRYGHRIPSRGEKNGMCKLTEDQVELIRQRYTRGDISQQKLADEYGVTQAHISLIVNIKARTI